jgi:hypothetical protein
MGGFFLLLSPNFAGEKKNKGGSIKRNAAQHIKVQGCDEANAASVPVC